MKKIVVLTGAGISADSGIATFRDSDGLWANYKIEEVCTPEALIRNREQVINFYNMRRKEILEKQPNPAHYALKKLEKYFEVEIITQNIDNMHERAGSSHITHLHGEITKLRSSKNENATVQIEEWEQKIDTRHPDGSLLRPFIVFFGESVPMLDKAIEITQKADILLIIGTSLAVYPAASLVNYIKHNVPIYIVDPGSPDTTYIRNRLTHIKKSAAEGVPELVDLLIKEEK